MHAFEEVVAAAVEIQAFCEKLKWQFCFIGGIAVQRWGSPRYTQDVDLTLLTGIGNEAAFVSAVLKSFPGRRQDASRFALLHRVLLVQSSAGIDVDMSLGALPFEERSIARATSWEIASDQSITTCSAEDLIVYKIVAGRDRDWSDVESVLARQHGKLNLSQALAELQPLLELKEDPESLEKFQQLVTRVERRLPS